MKSLMLAAAAALSLAGAAVAAPVGPVSDIQVTFGPALQAKADTYGQRDLDDLSERLRRNVTRELTRAGAMSPQGGRLELVIASAQPNHPTAQQLSDHPGLSIDSFSVGGASVEGRLVHPDGSIQPVGYSWYETDIADSRVTWTWTDAEYAFDAFARRLARGKALAER